MHEDNSFKVVAQLQYTMASSKFGCKLNPYRTLCEPLGVKGVRQPVVITNNPSSIDQNQQLLVGFPNLGVHDVFVSGTARQAFTIELDREDANRTVAQNLGRAIVKKLTIKISGNEVTSIDDSDVFHCYNDLWKTAPERANGHYQGIDASDNRNTTRIQSVVETEIQALPLTRPLLLPSEITSSPHSTSSCSRAPCHFTTGHLATGSSMNSRTMTTTL